MRSAASMAGDGCHSSTCGMRAGSMTSAADIRGCRSMRSAASNGGAGHMTYDRCVFCYNTAGDVRSTACIRSAGGVRGGSCIVSGRSL